jgi:hypothetical protein
VKPPEMRIKNAEKKFWNCPKKATPDGPVSIAMYLITTNPDASLTAVSIADKKEVLKMFIETY